MADLQVDDDGGLVWLEDQYVQLELEIYLKNIIWSHYHLHNFLFYNECILKHKCFTPKLHFGFQALKKQRLFTLE